MSERTPAFYTARYNDKTDFAFINDLAATVVEGEGLIWPYTLQYDPINNIVKDPKLGDVDVSAFYKGDSAVSRSGLFIKEVLIHMEPGIATVWISPPGIDDGDKTYKHTSIQVGYISINNDTGFKELNCYGIPSNEMGIKECFDVAENINCQFSQGLLLDSVKSIRETVFVLPIPTGERPIDFFRSIIPLQEKWDQIESGQAQLAVQKANIDAYEVALTTLPEARSAQTFEDHLIAGAHAEKLMMQRGWSLKNLDCDPPNQALLQNTITINEITLNQNGKINIISSEYKLIQNCGACGKSLKLYMKAKDRCPYCDKVYEGC